MKQESTASNGKHEMRSKKGSNNQKQITYMREAENKEKRKAKIYGKRESKNNIQSIILSLPSLNSNTGSMLPA